MASLRITQTIPPEPVSREQIEELSGEKISTCFQCQKCTNGCPLIFAMDVPPHRLMHSIQLGLLDEVLNSDAIWICASCETCTTRCPNDIDIAHIMDNLRQMSSKRGVKASQKQVPIYHVAFLLSIKRFGRIHEASMVLTYAFRSGGMGGVLKQSSLGLQMMRKGKVRLVPHWLMASKQVKDLFRKAGRKQAP